MEYLRLGCLQDGLKQELQHDALSQQITIPQQFFNIMQQHEHIQVRLSNVQLNDLGSAATIQETSTINGVQQSNTTSIGRSQQQQSAHTSLSTNNRPQNSNSNNQQYINFNTRPRYYNQQSGPVPIQFDEDTENVAFDIKLLHPITLGPRQECEVEMQVSISTADTVIFHPKQQLQHNPTTLMPHALLKITNYTTKLTVINLNDHPRYIPQNTRLDVITYAPSSVQCFALTSSSPSK
ncbi:unnamed protein product, partial [Didymodactylos carnosus]